MKVSSPGMTNQGGRSNNQDAMTSDWSDKEQTGYWIVADGLGGHEGGEVASSTACNSIRESLRNRKDDLLDQLESSIQTAHEAILSGQMKTEGLGDMRTTVVLLVIAGGIARWVHCGDTRLYYFHGTELREQTLDDSVPQALVSMGEISPLDIRNHEDRNRLTRCLGSSGSIRATLSQPVMMNAGDCFLLCSDGFWENVYEPEMLVDLAKATSCQDWLDRMSQRVMARVSGDHDNYTAMTVWVEEI